MLELIGSRLSYSWPGCLATTFNRFAASLPGEPTFDEFQQQLLLTWRLDQMERWQRLFRSAGLSLDAILRDFSERQHTTSDQRIAFKVQLASCGAGCIFLASEQLTIRDDLVAAWEVFVQECCPEIRVEQVLAAEEVFLTRRWISDVVDRSRRDGLWPPPAHSPQEVPLSWRQFAPEFVHI